MGAGAELVGGGRGAQGRVGPHVLQSEGAGESEARDGGDAHDDAFGRVFLHRTKEVGHCDSPIIDSAESGRSYL